MKHREENMQMAYVKWFDMQYPEDTTGILLNHNPSGGERPKKKIRGKWVAVGGERMRKMGAKDGIPDIMIYRPFRRHDRQIKYCGFAMELKATYMDGRKGVVSVAQKKRLAQLRAAGWYVCVKYNFDDAVEVTIQYLEARDL